MRGKSHVIVNTGTVIGAGSTLALMHNSDSNFVTNTADNILGFLFAHNFNVINTSLSMVLMIVFSAVMYLLGSLLPDIDHPYSTLGKIVHIPIKHRTWTHAVYAAVVFFLIGLKWRVFFWLGLGYFGHLFADSFSASGVNWLYPMKNKHHVMKLYYTSQPSEYTTVGIWLAVNILYCIISLCIIFDLFA